MNVRAFRTALLLAFALTAQAQSLNVTMAYVSSTATSTNTLTVSQTGSTGTLGNATLTSLSDSCALVNGALVGPAQATMGLYFNKVDSIVIQWTLSDPNYATYATVNMTGGVITGGTGAYAGATGNLDITAVKQTTSSYVSYANTITTGSGSVTAGGTTTPLILTLNGPFGAFGPNEDDILVDTITVTGSLGNGIGKAIEHYLLYPNLPENVNGSVTLNFSATDSLNIWYSYTPTTGVQAPSAGFSGFLEGGTGKYAGMGGAVTLKTVAVGKNGFGYKITGNAGSFTPGGTISQVNTVSGGPQLAYNSWIEIHGKNLTPPDTPAAGVDWSNAPDFANGMMPTQLGPISVVIDGQPAYVYWYCSAVTNPACAAGDQINVLVPPISQIRYATSIVVAENNGVPSEPFAVLRAPNSPSFFSLDAAGHVAARHQDGSLVGPASLYPGYTTPAKGGEIISIYGTGFGPPSSGSITAGSATQSGSLPGNVTCTISGLYQTPPSAG